MAAVFPNGAPETMNSMYPDDNVGDGVKETTLNILSLMATQ